MLGNKRVDIPVSRKRITHLFLYTFPVRNGLSLHIVDVGWLNFATSGPPITCWVSQLNRNPSCLPRQCYINYIFVGSIYCFGTFIRLVKAGIFIIELGFLSVNALEEFSWLTCQKLQAYLTCPPSSKLWEDQCHSVHYLESCLFTTLFCLVPS